MAAADIVTKQMTMSLPDAWESLCDELRAAVHLLEIPSEQHLWLFFPTSVVLVASCA